MSKGPSPAKPLSARSIRRLQQDLALRTGELAEARRLQQQQEKMAATLMEHNTNLNVQLQHSVHLEEIKAVGYLFRDNATMRETSLAGIKDEQRRRELRSEIIAFHNAADTVERRLIDGRLPVVACTPTGGTLDNGRIQNGDKASDQGEEGENPNPFIGV